MAIYNNLSEQIDVMMSKKLTRKQFLRLAVLGLISLTSLGNFLQQFERKQASSSGSDMTYGASTYGTAPISNA